MHAFKALIVAISTLAVSDATYVRANKGCVVAKGQKLCQGKYVIVSGQMDIMACVEKTPNGQVANCKWSGTIPENWEKAFFGEDNCVYGDGKDPIKLGCAASITSTPISPIY
ncbi:unnamed protein product [Periconia digitata]|uniref:Secreted protein n=1 Tax=Periconia digitata TaxID=1303443 RepID=A0A9W4UMU9_9PLEO|nr:unnamed protein product [Periconia digitata]